MTEITPIGNTSAQGRYQPLGVAEPPAEAEDLLVRIHFHGGSTAETLISDADVDGNVEQYIETTVTEPPKPHWAWIGGVFVFTQAVSGIEIADNEEEG